MNNPNPQLDAKIAAFVVTVASAIVIALVSIGIDNIYLGFAAGVSLWTVGITLTHILNAMPMRSNEQDEEQ